MRPRTLDDVVAWLGVLRKRLEQKCPDIRVVPTARGRFRLAVECDISLQTRR